MRHRRIPIEEHILTHVGNRVARRTYRWHIIAACLSILTTAIPASATILSQQIQPIAPGVTHTEMHTDSPGHNQAIHILTVDRSNPYIYLRAQLANGFVDRKEPVASQAKRASQPGAEVVAAVNGDFFTVATGTPTGMHMQQGEVVLSPNTRPVFAVKPDGELLIDSVTTMAKVVRLGAEGQAVGSAIAEAINRPRSANSLVIYTPRYGATTRTDAKGTEVELQSLPSVLTPGKPVTGVVTGKQSKVGSVAIPSDGIVLSGVGYSQAFLESLNLGDRVTIDITLPERFNTVTDAVSGRPVLVKNGKIAEMSRTDEFNTTRHPRTAVGFNDKQIFFVSVDGRQSGYADGMSTFELAELMFSLGATEAVNLDGGGSTTFAVRLPGDAQLSVANSPSDGQERSVGNSVLVVNTAPAGSLTHLYLEPASVTVLIGSQVQFDVAGQDEYFGPAQVPAEGMQWLVDGTAGSVTNGLFTAQQAGSATVKATVTSPTATPLTQATGTAQVTVVDRISRLEVTPQTAVAGLGDVVDFAVKGYDEAGRPVIVSPSLVQWSVEGGVATINAVGHAVAFKMGDGKIVAKLGELVVRIPFAVGKPPVLLSDFEDAAPWKATTSRAAATFEITIAPDPVHNGTYSGKLAYDFTTGPTGTAAAYVEAPNRIKIEGRPLKIGVWVYGDGHGHWLRAHYFDGKGAQKVMDFTSTSGFDWIGWQYVEAPVDQYAPLPLEFQRIYVVETNNEKKDKGIVYFDNLTAVYSDVPSETN